LPDWLTCVAKKSALKNNFINQTIHCAISNTHNDASTMQNNRL